ncbi:MAG TPA: patatin-like phospholipase family protein [Burkholderiales bacterium]|nr:patatin-like phospholipase family protein [Burkholderiales bacterium]
MPHIESDRTDFTYGGAAQLVGEEAAHLKRWRGDGAAPRAGLALSGGGIRSASYALGVLQALAHAKWLPKFDYLSTVSGGGYIGSSLSYLLHRKWEWAASGGGKRPDIAFDVSKDDFPYQSFPMVSVPPPADNEAARVKGRLLRILRQNASYLTPGCSISLLSLIGVVLRNSAVSLLVYLMLAVFVFGVLVLKALPAPAAANGGSNLLLRVALVLLAFYCVLSLVYALATRLFGIALKEAQNYRLRRLYEQACHWLFLIALCLLALAGIPWLYALLHSAGDGAGNVPGWLKDPSVLTGIGSAIAGLVTTLAAHFQSGRAQKPGVTTGLLVFAGSVLLLFGLLLLAYAASGNFAAAVACGVIGLVLGWFADLNYLCLHRYYRDRLMEAFMPDMNRVIANEDLRSGITPAGNDAMLGTACGVHPEELPAAARRQAGRDGNGPYHLINTNVVLVASETPKYRGRGGDNFILSPLYCGSNATGWSPTNPKRDEGLTLATAMAISGAAVNPDAGCGGEGVTRQPVLSVLMSLLNIRLGYWFRNPRYTGRTGRPNFLRPGLAEVVGRLNLNESEKTESILLTDGGHFENLGIYELVRRRLKLIVACDGGADPEYTFSDLANAIEKVRADFGAIIEVSDVDLHDLIPRPEDGAKADAGSSAKKFAERGYLFATIRYAKANQKDANAYGMLIYMTTTFFRGLSADLYGYRNAHPSFPDEPTSDQFFDEKQFEAYRELGYQTARAMMMAASADDLAIEAREDGKVEAAEAALEGFREMGFEPPGEGTPGRSGT